MQSSRLGIRMVIAVAAVALAIAGWWFCERNSSTAFLPSHSGAEWIIDPMPPEAKARTAFPKQAIFNRALTLMRSPVNATLTVMAFKDVGIFVNGKNVAG